MYHIVGVLRRVLIWFLDIVPPAVETLTADLRGLQNGDVEADAEAEQEWDIFGNVFNGEGPFDEVARRNRSNSRRIRAIVRAATHCRVAHGCPDDTPANRLMCSDTIRRFMQEEGMRPAHISTAFPIAVAMALTPLESDVILAQMLQSTTARAARRNVTATYRSGWTRSALGSLLG